MRFTENLRTTVADYVAKIKKKEAEIAYHQTNGINHYSDATYKEMAVELNEQHTLLMSEAVNAAKTIIDEYKSELPARFVVTGGSVDTGDMTLLNSNYKLTKADLESMYDRHTPVNGFQNHTMIKLIFDYCERNDIEIDRVYRGEAAKANAADALFSWAKSCYQRPDYNMETEEYFAQILPDVLAGE